MLSIICFIFQHLENPNTYTRLLFVDFSCAFNTTSFSVNSDRCLLAQYIIRWYYSFLTNGTQQVCVNQTLSESKVIKTGVPQGCAHSPILCTLYTNDCTSSHPSTFTVKFSDDTAILGLRDADTDISGYSLEV